MALSKNAAERLKSELLLTKGGGIYYDAARVDADERVATLFVGLGGTGADMLIRIKNEVKRRMVLPQINGKIVGDTPKNIGFLAFDTDSNSMLKTWGIASFDPFGSEFCSLEVDNLPHVIASRKQLAESGDPVWSWYDKIDPVAGLDGAGGLRQIGRLMMFENIGRVYDTLYKKIKKLVQVNEGIDSVMVVVVAGIAGGTGSGTLIDMAYLLRKVLVDMAVNNQRLLGYIVLPDVNLLNGGQPEKIWTNAFACLKELDYWMSPGSDEQNDKFVQKYGNNIEVNNITSRAFDYCHLLSSQDMEGRPLTYDKVISSMAENVFAYVAGEAGVQAGGNTSMSQMYDNIDTYMGTLAARAPLPACYRYLAVGSHKLEIPYEEISTLLAVRLFERLKPIFALRPTEESFVADMTSLRLIPKKVIHDSLTEKVPASPVDGKVNYQYGQIWGGGNNSYNRNTAYYDVKEWIAREFQTAVTHSAANFVNVQNGFFLDFVRDRIKKADRGPIYLAALLNSDSKWSIIPTLEGIATHCDEVAATCDSKRESFEKELKLAYEAGQSKIIRKQKAVQSYIIALREWMDNENGVLVYTERARVVRELCKKFRIYYDKIFSRLADVIEELPDIFRQNLDYIALAQKEAADKGLLDDSKLIWPLKFEEENRAKFEELLAAACNNFLGSLSLNLSKWTGCDLETIDENSSGTTDVPGFISKFVSEQFGSLLNINMEKIMRSKLGGAEDLDDFLHHQLLRLCDRSIPMFSIRAEYSKKFASEFAIASVPDNCLHIKAAANKYLSEKGAIVKVSKERTRVYYVKVISGIPLYAYTKIEEAEKEYEKAIRIPATRKGSHLVPEWLDRFPSPLPEGAWTPEVYCNTRVLSLNRQIREAFDRCVNQGVIVADNPEAPMKYFLRIADAKKAEIFRTVLRGSIDEKLEQLQEVREELWGGRTLELPSMGTCKNTDGKSLIDNVRECVLRLPHISTIIRGQADLLEKFEALTREIEDPKYFAFAVLCGLVVKQGFEIVLKRSANSAIVSPLHDTTLDKPFIEYEAYKSFRLLLDDNRRNEIEQIRSELMRRIGQGSPEKAETRERANAVIEQYFVALQEVKSKYDRAPLDKRKGLQDMVDFYSSVISIATAYRDRYLA